MADKTRKAHSLTGTAHGLLWPLIFLLLAGWVVELIGLSGLQHTCPPDSFVSTPLYATSTQLPSGLACRSVYRWLWWTLVLQFPVFLMIVTTVGLHVAHPGSWTGLVGLLSVVTVMQMWATNITLNLKDAFYYREGINYARTAFAGFLITSFADLCLMMAIGFASSLSYTPHVHTREEYGTLPATTLPATTAPGHHVHTTTTGAAIV